MIKSLLKYSATTVATAALVLSQTQAAGAAPLPGPSSFLSPEAQEKIREASALPLIVPAEGRQPVNPDAPKNYVSLGDSAVSNVTMLDVVGTAIDKKNPNFNWPNMAPNGCAQNADAFPVRVAEQTGLKLDDFACAGYTLAAPTDIFGTMNEQLDDALEAGALNENTELVSVMAGFNDTYQLNRMDPSQYDLYNEFGAEETARLINRIGEAAPNAKIMVMGYPDQLDGNGRICQINAMGMVSRTYYPLLDFLQKQITFQQREGVKRAQVDNVEFYDAPAEINVANNNNACSNNPDRLGAAWFDDAPHNIAGHLTTKGNEHYANVLTDYYNRAQ